MMQFYVQDQAWLFIEGSLQKAAQGSMVSFKGVSCHGSSPVGHGPCQEFYNCSDLFFLGKV